MSPHISRLVIVYCCRHVISFRLCSECYTSSFLRVFLLSLLNVVDYSITLHHTYSLFFCVHAFCCSPWYFHFTLILILIPILVLTFHFFSHSSLPSSFLLSVLIFSLTNHSNSFSSGAAFFSLTLFPAFFAPITAKIGTTPLMLAVLIGAAQNILSKGQSCSQLWCDDEKKDEIDWCYKLLRVIIWTFDSDLMYVNSPSPPVHAHVYAQVYL